MLRISLTIFGASGGNISLWTGGELVQSMDVKNCDDIFECWKKLNEKALEVFGVLPINHSFLVVGY